MGTIYDTEKDSPVERYVLMVRVGIAIVALLLLVLPFHYVLDPFTVVTKKHWGFSQTIVTSGWIKKTINSYNSSDSNRKKEIMENPVVSRLLNRKLIYLSDIQ